MTPRSTLEPLEVRRLLSAAANELPQRVDITWNDSTSEAIAGQWIVKLGGYRGLAGSQLQKARRLLSAADENVFVRQYLVSDGLFSVRLPSTLTSEQQYAKLKEMPGFVSAEPDFIQYTDLTPNDPSFSQLSGLNQANDQDIDAPEAWNTTQGSMSQVVGIVDSGVEYNHPDLYLNIFLNQAEIPATRLANLTDIDADGLITFRDLNNAANQGVGKIQDQNADGRITGADLRATMNTTSGVDNGTGGWANGTDGDANGFVDDLVGWNFLSGNNDPNDVFGHGSHVAGTVGAVGNNSVGVVGVNWKVRLMPLKTGGINSSDNSISTSAAIAALNYAVLMKQRGNALRVTNNSWGGGGISAQLEGAIGNNANNNIMFVAAAGNDGTNNDTTPHYPSSYVGANIVAVANLTNTGARNGGSNFGVVSVDIGAPGTNILSTTGGAYQIFTGTSMASPHVAGVAALAFSVAPGATVATVKAAMLNNVDVIASLNGVVATGGRVNAQKTLAAIAGFPDSPAGLDMSLGSDTGINSADDVTNDNTPTFSGTAPAGTTVTLLADDVAVGSIVAAGNGTWTITATTLADGVRTITATSTNGAGTSAPSEPVFVTVDTAAPTGSNPGFPFAVAPHRTTFNFNEDMSAALTTGMLTVTNLTTSTVLTGADLSLTFNALNQVQINFPTAPAGILPDGNYRVSVQATDLAGNVMPAAYVYDFFFLGADGNRDRKVDIGDFGSLASNFNRSPRNFGQGDYNYSGTVDIDDFSILATRFNVQLPAPSALPRAAGAVAAADPLFSGIEIDRPANDLLSDGGVV